MESLHFVLSSHLLLYVLIVFDFSVISITTLLYSLDIVKVVLLTISFLLLVLLTELTNY